MDSKERNDNVLEIAELVSRYLRGNLRPGEEERLDAWLEEDPRNREFLRSLTGTAALEECLDFLSSVDTPVALDKVLARIKARGRQASGGEISRRQTSGETSGRKPLPRAMGSLKRMLHWKVAAAVLLLLTALAVLLLRPGPEHGRLMSAGSQQQDVPPGSDKAVLRLADGSTITLDDNQEGMIRDGDGIRIRQHDGEVIYEVTASATSAGRGAWNTISTPRGGQYQVKLPDGSRAWLNAASELRFPAVFTGSRREVELSGEAYFEIAHNRNKPFRVKVNGLTVEVLGTHFNVKAYDDEQIVQTTLIEGSVKVTTPSAEEVLLPGRQASMDKVGSRLQIRAVNTEDVLAWKNGLFRFSDESIEAVMKKIGRWYDIQVDYGSGRPETLFTGMISRKVPLSQVLEMLEMTGGARFRLEGKTVTVVP